MKLRILLAALLAVALSSCYTTHPVSMQSDYEQAYIGSDYHSIVQHLGAPDRTAPDGNDGQILIYEQQVTSTHAVTRRTDLDYIPTTITSNTYASYLQLFIDKDNRCYAVKTNHTKGEKAYDKRATWLLGGSIAVTAAIITTAIIISHKNDAEFNSHIKNFAVE